MSWDGIDSIVGKRGLFMCRIASLFLLQRLKGSMPGDARDFNNMETRAIIKMFFQQGKVPEEIHAIVTETLGERVGPIVHEGFDMRKLSAKWVPKCLNADQNCQRCQSSEQIWNFFGAIQMISCCDWRLWTKPGHITMTRRQSNNKWSGGIAAHPAPNISLYKNPLENFSPRFFGIKTSSSTLIIFQRTKLSTRSIAHFCWCNWRTFWRKNSSRRSPRLFCSCTTMHRLTGHLQPRRNWPVWASSLLITHPFLLIWPRHTTTCSLVWKKIESLPFFLQRGGHCCREDLVGRKTFWIFFLSD